MPMKSAKQNRLMQTAAHSPSVAKRTGVPQHVAQEFVAAQHGKPVPKGNKPMKKSSRGR